MSFNVKYFLEYLHTPVGEQWDSVSACVKKTKQNDMSYCVGKNGICQINKCKSESIQ